TVRSKSPREPGRLRCQEHARPPSAPHARQGVRSCAGPAPASGPAAPLLRWCSIIAPVPAAVPKTSATETRPPPRARHKGRTMSPLALGGVLVRRRERRRARERGPSAAQPSQEDRVTAEGAGAAGKQRNCKDGCRRLATEGLLSRPGVPEGAAQDLG